MTIEIKKPQTIEDLNSRWTNPDQAHDTVTGGDETTYASGELATADETSGRFYNWETKGARPYATTVLKVKWTAPDGGSDGDDQWEIDYTKDGGAGWPDLLAKGLNRNIIIQTAQIALDNDQDLTQVEIRIITDRVVGPDGDEIRIWDIWTEGSISSSSSSKSSSSSSLSLSSSSSSSLSLSSSSSSVSFSSSSLSLSSSSSSSSWSAANTETWGENTGDDYTGVTEDTYIDKINNTTNYNGSELQTQEITGVDIQRSLIKFHLVNQIYQATVFKAELWLYCYSDNDVVNHRAEAMRCVQNWTEAGATWEKYDGVTDWPNAGAANAGDAEDDSLIYDKDNKYFTNSLDHQSGNWYSFDITSLVQKWVDRDAKEYGVVVRSRRSPAPFSPTRQVLYRDSESSDTFRPYLKIWYDGGTSFSSSSSSVSSSSSSLSLSSSSSLSSSESSSSSKSSSSKSSSSESSSSESSSSSISWTAETFGENTGDDYSGGTEDCHMDEQNPTFQEDTNDIIVGQEAGGDYTAWMKFHITDKIYEANVWKAEFHFYVSAVAGTMGNNALTFFRCVTGDPVENQLTWNIRKTGTNWAAGGGQGGVSGAADDSIYDIDTDYENFGQVPSTGWKFIDLTDLIKSWLDGTRKEYGFVMLQNDPDNNY
ncbi:hypothetical protein LCGC14_1929180, partial [marine sediment metagenome]